MAVIAATGNPGGPIAAKMATATIPIVFSIPDDPQQLGLVTNLARPSENVTGITALVGLLAAKRLELIRDLIARPTLIGILMNRIDAGSRAHAKDIQEAANLVGQQIELFDVGNEDEMDASFAALVRLHAGALVVVSDNFLVGRREQLVQLAARYAFPRSTKTGISRRPVD